MIELPQEFVSECHRLAGAIAPEIGCPLYVMPQPNGIPAPSGADAYALSHGDLLLQEHLEAVGEWRGPGLFVVFAALSGHRETDVGLFLHELSHLLPFYSAPPPLVRTPEARDFYCRLAAYTAEPETDFQRGFSVAVHHGAHFTRACLHVGYRAVMAGFHLLPPFDALRFAGERYEQFDAYDYFQAIGGTRGELSAKFDTQTISEILRTPAPAAFQELADLDRERQRRLTAKDAA